MNTAVDKTETDSLRDNIAAVDPIYEVGNRQIAVVPKGYELKDLEAYLPHPARKRGTFTAKSPADFVHYLTTQREANGSAVYLDLMNTAIYSILDGHFSNLVQPSEAGWGNHRARMDLTFTPEWLTWTGSDKDQMNQVDFAEFIEDNLLDILEPKPAEMLEMSKTMQVKKGLQIDTALDLDNGSLVFSYNETVRGTTNQGKVKVPHKFKIAVPVFVGGTRDKNQNLVRYSVECRFRYRASAEGVRMFYQLIKPERVKEVAFGEIAAAIRRGLDDGKVTPIYEGSFSDRNS